MATLAFAAHSLAYASGFHAPAARAAESRLYEFANGQPVELEYGFARVSFLGSETVTPILFGPPNVEPILGVVALDSTGVVVDPLGVKRRWWIKSSSPAAWMNLSVAGSSGRRYGAKRSEGELNNFATALRIYLAAGRFRCQCVGTIS